MTERPDKYSPAARPWNLITGSATIALSSIALSGRAYDAVRERAPLPSRRTVQAIAVATFAVHAIEARSAVRMAKARGLTRSAWRFGAATMLVGFPVLLTLRSLDSPEGAGQQG